MAIGATIYNFDVNLSDISKDFYQLISIRAAMHPSENMEFLICRVLAYCIEYQEQIEFTKGLSEPELPAIWVKDYTGNVLHWIEVGSPSADKLHKASKAAGKVTIYTYKQAGSVFDQLSGAKIYKSEEIKINTFTTGFISEIVAHTERRNTWQLSINENTLYLELGGRDLTTPLISSAVPQ